MARRRAKRAKRALSFWAKIPMTRGEAFLATPTITLLIAGVDMVGSASARTATGSGNFFKSTTAKEAVYAAFGAVLYFQIRKIPVASMLRWSKYFLGACFVALLLVPIFGVEIDGGKRWLGVGPLLVQPSEFTKLAFVLAAAAWIASAERESSDWLRSAYLLVPLIAVTFLIVKTEHDAGTGAVIFFSTFAIYFAAGIKRRTFYQVFSVALIGLVGSLSIHKYQRDRIKGLFLQNEGWQSFNQQAHQARIGFGAGGLWGLGYGNGREKWGLVANPHSDFIFATIGEELGFIGSVATLVLLGWLLLGAWRIAMNARRRDSQLLAVGIASWFTIQIGMNIGSVTGLFPVTGVPLPLVSYGGTSLVVNLAALAVLGAVARETEKSLTTVSSEPVAARAR